MPLMSSWCNCWPRPPLNLFCVSFRVWILCYYYQSIFINSPSGLFVAMISEGHVYVVNEGEPVSLECNFHADQYDLFDYPVLWRKNQYSEEAQINIMGTIAEPFINSLRFDVAFTVTALRYRLSLTINEVTQEDNGNYTCEVRAPEAITLGHVTHHLYVRAPTKRLIIALNEQNASMSQDDVLSESQLDQLLESHQLVEGRPVSITCLAVGGYPPPSLTVRLGRKDVTNDWSFKADAVLLPGEGPGLRRIEYHSWRWKHRYVPRAEDNQVLLQCIAQVSGLDVTTETVRLHVQYSPKILCYSTSAYINEKNVNIYCNVASNPHVLELHWVLDANGTVVKEGELVSEYWTATTDHHDGAIEVRLFIRKVTSVSFRKYLLVAVNAVDRTSATVELMQRYRLTTEKPLTDSTVLMHQYEQHSSMVDQKFSPSVTRKGLLDVLWFSVAMSVCSARHLIFLCSITLTFKNFFVK